MLPVIKTQMIVIFQNIRYLVSSWLLKLIIQLFSLSYLDLTIVVCLLT